MNPFSLSSDDLPPVQETQEDRVLRRQLETSISKHFYEACDGVTQSLLMNCEWYITTIAKALTLVVSCPDMMTNWRMLNNTVPVASCLAQFSEQARIRVCPPINTGTPFEIRVDELDIYRDSL